MTDPPGLPGAPASSKRILPALLLAGTVGFMGLHRFYTGRYISGSIQLLLFAAGCAMARGIWAAVKTIENMDQSQLQDMILNGTVTTVFHVSPLASLLLGIPICWAALDCILLGARQFKDGRGIKMNRWV
jgi:hypothetical protein